jgi:hypothetical protein
MNTNFWACCFKAPERTHGKQIVSGFQLDKETEADICSGAYCPAWDALSFLPHETMLLPSILFLALPWSV